MPRWPACNPDQPAPLPMKSSGGCSVGGNAPLSGMLVMLLLMAVGLRCRFV
jgi:MYXO-CTERM domain-containing protein